MDENGTDQIFFVRLKYGNWAVQITMKKSAQAFIGQKKPQQQNKNTGLVAIFLLSDCSLLLRWV